MQNMIGSSKKIVGTDNKATVMAWPALNILIPDSFQNPPIEAANEKQKQSAKPMTKQAM